MERAPSSKSFPAILRFLMVALLLGAFTLPVLVRNNPVPLVNQPLVPDAIAPGGTCSVIVRFISTERGARTATLGIVEAAARR
jgi:hypothetical protein